MTAELPADPEPSTSTRPSFTVTAAATATGKSRRTIGRMLDADELPGATRDDSGTWSIPAEALLAAGLTLHAPAPPDPPPDPAPNSRALDPLPGPEADPAELAKLRAELADWRRRAEVAEAVADERAAALADVRQALDLATRMLPASTTPTGEFPNAVDAEFSHPVTPSVTSPEAANSRGETVLVRRRWWHRR